MMNILETEQPITCMLWKSLLELYPVTLVSSVDRLHNRAPI